MNLVELRTLKIDECFTTINSRGYSSQLQEIQDMFTSLFQMVPRLERLKIRYKDYHDVFPLDSLRHLSSSLRSLRLVGSSLNVLSPSDLEIIEGALPVMDELGLLLYTQAGLHPFGVREI